MAGMAGRCHPQRPWPDEERPPRPPPAPGRLRALALLFASALLLLVAVWPAPGGRPLLPAFAGARLSSLPARCGLVPREAAKKKASGRRKKKVEEEPPAEAKAEEGSLNEGDTFVDEDGDDDGDDDDFGTPSSWSSNDEDDDSSFDPEDGPQPAKRKGYTRIQDEEILPPGTKYQGGRHGLQFFVGDLVEVMRDGKLQYARVARIPTDERPMDGSFMVKWDSDGEEWKCAYRDLRKPRNPDGVDWPDWIEDWWPAEPPEILEEELKKEWKWVSDLRPGGKGGGAVPNAPDQGVYSQSKDDPYRPKPYQVLYGHTCEPLDDLR